jgi:hypothetical protein
VASSISVVDHENGEGQELIASFQGWILVVEDGPQIVEPA